MQYADEAVVVMNFTPMKASNGLEEKKKREGCRFNNGDGSESKAPI
ncbi:hypothetical protein [Acetobacterium malicum]